ncbi:c-type cytochrome [Desulfocurvibacter africanus]|uniref:c-type cytochrome n=1 Tax=Desulfocurvibacter africanus TaxID=873 RepID=UPI0003FC0EFE|nr:c-type cytochrome [Desulfocurvibacter africanus]
MKLILCLAFTAAFALIACAGKTAQDIPAEQRTPEGIFTQICSRCHGDQAQSRAYGVSQVIANMSAEEIEQALRGYRAGTYGGAFKGVMREQAGSLSEEEIPAVAAYVSALGQ